MGLFSCANQIPIQVKMSGKTRYLDHVEKLSSSTCFVLQMPPASMFIQFQQICGIHSIPYWLLLQQHRI